MNNETPQRRIADDQPGPTPRRIDLDWTESEWFQVWLDLARQPYLKQTSQFELASQTP